MLSIILQAKAFNTRLLSEMIEHPNFFEFMTDIEIYIDGIASIQINTLNSIVDKAQETIIKAYNPDENEFYMKTMTAAKISEERYFHSIIHEDIDVIADDICKSHAENKKDITTNPEDVTLLDMMNEGLKKADAYGSSPQNKQMMFFLGMLGTDINRLNENERRVLQGIIRKSKYMKKKKS